MNQTVSICVPTYERPQILCEAVDSCLAQTYRDIEILICDDSESDLTEEALRKSGRMSGLRYYRNRPRLGQAGNVNRLFDLAEGDRLVLLHDDDLLLPTAVADLAACWETEPDLTAAFGKQYVIAAGGEVLEEESRRLNETYHRGPRNAGRQPPLWSALVCQFPNDGYLVLTEAARRTRYRESKDIGDACDFDFGLRLASQYDGFCFLDKHTAKYRRTAVSVSAGNALVIPSYRLVEEIPLPLDLEVVRAERLRGLAPAAINRWLLVGDRQNARRVYFSDHCPWSKRCSVMGAVQAVLLACPAPIGSRLASVLQQTRQALRLHRRA